MDNNQLISVIDNAVASIRRNQHQDNPQLGFAADYYAVSKDGKVSKSVSSSVFKDAEWGFVQVFYAFKTNKGYQSSYGYQYLYDSGTENLYVCPNGNIETTAVKLGSWQISLVPNTVGEYRIQAYNPRLQCFFFCKGELITEQIEEMVALLPMIEGCTTEDAVKQIFTLFENNEKKSKEDIINYLVKENKELKEKLNKIKSIIGD